MVATDISPVSHLLTMLDELTDEELRMVIAHAQGLLLDRPAALDTTPLLAVEVVGREEGRLLAAYRALAPLRQRRILSHVMHLVHASRRLGSRATATAAATAMSLPGALRS